MLVGTFFELFEKAATETRAHADARVEHTRTRACASMSHLMKERARLESKKAPDSWGALRVSLGTQYCQ